MVESHWEGKANYSGRVGEMSLGVVEGINKFRAIQRITYGFRDEDYFYLEILTVGSQTQKITP